VLPGAVSYLDVSLHLLLITISQYTYVLRQKVHNDLVTLLQKIQLTMDQSFHHHNRSFHHSHYLLTHT